MADSMSFPDTFDEFAEQYKIVDKEEAYTNGSELIPIFRVKQWLEHSDVVEVVRCKNCRHLERDDGLKSGKMCLIRGSSGWCDDNDFCSYGEPKTEDNHAHWEYWSGWAGNHDQRIEDATCSNCGYKHPTVRLDYVDGKFIKGYVPDKLAKECPKCGAKMDE